uniref:Transmembrane protein n=1 Tax=Entomoneis paludosa TaxID=265537 RepID=A0A7S2Y222_9STRA|mmetsp:Transcript_10072/g.20801  ORF Transcript_10072/g.20801 Transcript_10072/m.20801 type:complete len:206 (+) Transcript_10072:82-699(+)|eukprot:CAMPEP_0172439824 /NCGR_PEP_ID=MMETSP1065-20121228/685_1 /TAXON_ID=265537 /ORGANISM="Amphiprora paludosa, Strain CCMP125" /LENGTH=205 /DNA_ID=CAMNT_0013188559 /DNA_START=20 /DNA_END=637 /DNA_ORIENTATION=-
MSTSETSSNKAIYTAVPLLPRDNDDLDESHTTAAVEQLLPQEHIHQDHEEEADAVTTQKHSLKPFFFGMMIGLACYCLVDSNLIPSFQLQNVLVNSLATALMWSTITSALAYGIFWSVWTVMERSVSEGSILENQDFFEHMEYYFTLGVFLGFCTACTVDVILFGIPLLGVMSMVLVAFLWTLVMLNVAPPQQRSKGTVLPMVIV